MTIEDVIKERLADDVVAEKEGMAKAMLHPDRSETISVTKMYKEGGVVTQEEISDDDTVDVLVPDSRLPMAEVCFGARMTINLGNFESVQVSVEIKLPTYREQIDDAFRAAKNLVDNRLNREINDIKEYRKAKGKA